MTTEGPTPHREHHHATPAILARMKEIEPLLSPWPEILPTLERPTILPLRLGIAKEIAARIMAPEGMSKTQARRKVTKAIHYLTNTRVYLRACAVRAIRCDINRDPVKRVSAEEAEFARKALAKIKASAERKRGSGTVST